MRPAKLTLIAVAALLALPGAAAAATLQPVGEFDDPIYVTSAPRDPGRLLVVERRGRIELVQNGTTTLFADLEAEVGCGGGCSGERGLLSIAFSPDFEQSGRLYVDYAENATGTIHVEALTAEGPAHETADPSTLVPMLEIPHNEDDTHNGGQLQIGPEGNLFISTGDGGGANDQFHHAQDRDSQLGKILRIEPDPAGPPPHFKIPAGNPFAAEAGVAKQVWSYGLRNPFRFSFDKTTGAMLIGDVGQGAREEVDHAAAPLFGAGLNYGWNCHEGLIKGPFDDPGCAAGEAAKAFADPLFEYPHLDPGGGKAFGCAIIGGYVAREPTLTELSGRYVYGDLCGGGIRSLDLRDPFASDRSEGLSVANLNSFGEDSSGRLYAVSGNGPVYRILAAPLSVPPVLTSSRTVPFVGIRAASRRVQRGGRAEITAFVSPCLRSQARSVVVVLRRGHQGLGRKHLSRVCTAGFRPRIGRRARFHVQLVEDSTYTGGESRGLTIKPRARVRASRGRG
jgi:hypothetical protein